MKRRIPFIKPYTPDMHDVMQVYSKIKKSGQLTSGHFVRRVEKCIAEYLDVPKENVVATNSASNGLMLVLSALKKPHPSFAAVSDYGFAATVPPMVWNRLIPLLIDIDERTCMMNSMLLKPQFLEHFAEHVQFIIPTNLYGTPVKMKSIQKRADDINATVVYDSAQALGATYRGKKVGSEGTHVFSFSPVKIVTGMEGGCIVTDREDLVETLRNGRNYGLDARRVYRSAGINARMTELSAAMILLGMEDLDLRITKRIELATQYSKGLLDIKDKVDVLTVHGEPNGYMFPIFVREDECTARSIRLALGKYLLKNGIDARSCYFDPPLHTMMDMNAPVITNGINRSSICAGGCMCLPLHDDLTMNDVDKVVSCIKTFFEDKKWTSTK